MTLYWRTSLICTLIMSMVLSSVPVNFAFAGSSSTQWQEVKDNLELVKPVRRSETFAELYYRLETRLSEQQKDEFGVINKKMKYQMPMYRVPKDVKVSDTSAVFTDDGQMIVLEVKKDDDGNPYISINDRRLTEEEALSPLKTFSIVKALKTSNNKSKSAWLWNMFFPQAEAFSWNWGTILAVALPAAAIGYMIYKKNKDKGGSCKNKSAICCNVSGTLTQLSSGCCKDAGGSDTNYGTCPAAMYIEGETTASATSESATATTVDTSSSSSATVEANVSGVK